MTGFLTISQNGRKVGRLGPGGRCVKYGLGLAWVDGCG